MKKILFATLILLISTAFSNAQPLAINKIYEKYAGEKGFTAIDLTDPSVISSMLSENEKDDKIEGILNSIKGVQILVYEGDKNKNSQKAKEFKHDIRNIESLSGFKTFLSVNDEDSYVRMMTKKNKKADDSEFLMLVIDDNEIVMIWIKGEIGLKDVKKIGKIMKGL